MTQETTLPSRRLGLRVFSHARALLAVSALAALAVPTRSLALPTQTLTILGGYTTAPQVPVNEPRNGSMGTQRIVDPYTEASRDGGATWQPAYLTGWHPWGFINGTNSWINFDPNPFVGLNSTTLYRIRFVAPADASNPRFNLQMRADNFSVATFNGQQIGANQGDQGPSADLVYVNSMQPGENAIYLSVRDTGGWVGFNYRIDIIMEASQPPTAIPAPVAQPPVVSSGSAAGTYGTPFSYTISATNSPTSYGATNLPPGLTRSGAVISGTPTQAGNFTVGLSATNADGTGNGTLSLNIAKATATVTINSATLSQTYDGTAKVVTATTSNPSGLAVVINYLGNHTDAGSCPVLAVIDSIANPNYTGSVTGTLEIAKANAAISVTGYSGTYDGAAHGATGAATGAGSVGLAGLSLGATFIGVPGGTANWTFAGSANYNAASGSVAIVINKAPATVTVTPYNVIYDGQPRSANATVTGVNGETGATVGTVTLNTTHTNAGTYTDSWSFTGGTNYKDIASTSITDTIAKANATVVVTGYNAEYDGLPHSATATITGVNGETGATVGTVTLNTTHTTVGTYADTWSFTGAANYNNTSGTVTDKIKDTTAPAITATMTPRGGGDDESSQFFTMAFTATDLVGVKTLTAVLNGVTVTNGQVVQLQTIKSGAQSVKRDDGKLQIKATSFALVVTAVDVAGNVSTKTVVPVFVKNGKDDEDKKGEDKKGEDKKDSDSKGGDDKKGS